MTRTAFELIRPDKLLDLAAERIDLAIRLGRLADSSTIAHRLCDTVYVVAASPEYRRQRGRPATPAEFAHHDCRRTRCRATGHAGASAPRAA